MTLENRRWTLAARPSDDAKLSDFDMQTVDAEEPADGDVLVRVIYLSLDPSNRVWMNERDSYMSAIKIGEVMRGIAVGVVEQTRAPSLKEGDLVQGMFGWQTYAIAKAKDVIKLPTLPFPLQSVLAVLGHIGATAYFGMELAQLVADETVVVSAAAGGVGSLAGQIARIKGCRVVGIAGTDEKCEWIKGELGYDAAINYKTQKVSSALRESCPDGIDVYFDNVGGDILEAALAQINIRARIICCGMISKYNASSPVPGPSNLDSLIVKRARMEGFIVTDYQDRFMESAMQLVQWMNSGELRYRVDLVDGLENAPRALRRLFDGDNVGKLMVRVSDEP